MNQTVNSNRKIIDFHTHAFPDKIAEKTISFLSEKGGIPAYTNGTVTHLSKTLFEGGISLGVVLPVVTKPEQFASITKFAGTINETSFRRENEGAELLSFGGIHPDSTDYKKELKELKELGFKGVKLHPDYQGVDIDDIRFLRIMEYASELSLIIVTHAGIDIGFHDVVRCTPKKAKHAITEVHPGKLVLAHTGGYGLWEEVVAELVGENVYFDSAFSMGRISEELFMKICRTHGTDKILFATDCPWSCPKEDVETFLKMPFTREEQEKILHENAEKLLSAE